MKLSLSGLSVLSVLAALAVASSAAGCAAPTDAEDVAESQGSEVRSNPVYDAVIREGTKIETDRTRSAQQSASTHLIGFLPRARAAAVLDQLLAVQRWTEIRDPEGEKPFERAQLVSDSEADGVRTVTAKITAEGGAKLDIRGTAAASGEDDAIVVTLTNTNAFKHWLAGTVMDANKLTIAIRLIPYEGGVIVDATMRVKLRKMEDEAAALTGSLAPIFEWLAP